MARREDRTKAIELRKKGHSYSQIKEALGVSKSTLSLWLRELPLSEERVRALRDFNHIRIEKTRLTKLLKKKNRRDQVYEQVKFDISHSKDTLFVGGFFLYWGEGTKSAEYSVALTSSDPAIIKFFVTWLQKLGVSTLACKVKIHLYSDQIEEDIKIFWSHITGIHTSNFYKPYVKESTLSGKTYQGMFTKGTCTVYYHDRDLYEYVLAGINYLRDSA